MSQPHTRVRETEARQLSLLPAAWQPPRIDPPVAVGKTDTSAAAAKMVARHVETDRDRVLRFVAAQGSRGCTSHELADHFDRPFHTIAPRLTDLRHAGAIRDSGQRRRWPGVRTALIVWIANTTEATT